jgi:hypothetical protein
MAVYVVTWDLNREKPNYPAARVAFIAHLDRYQSIRDPGLDSVRFVSTDWSADQVSADLETKLDSNDRLVVTKLVPSTHQGRLLPTVWDWINARINL